MKKTVETLLPLRIFLLVGCGAAGGASPKPGPVTSADDIIGAWHRTSGGPSYMSFHENGSANGSQKLETAIEGLEISEWKYWFEGTQPFIIIEETSVELGDEPRKRL